MSSKTTKQVNWSIVNVDVLHNAVSVQYNLNFAVNSTFLQLNFFLFHITDGVTTVFEDDQERRDNLHVWPFQASILVNQQNR